RHAAVAAVHYGMLHERHADATDHATDALTARCLRVDDPAGPISANDAPHARFPEIRIDGDFHEYGAERMHRKPLARTARLHVNRDLDGLADASHRISEIIGAAA